MPSIRTPSVRFDDRLVTALRDDRPRGPSAVAQWRQLLDLLAQRPTPGQEQQAIAALRRLRMLHDAVSPQDRARAVRALDGQLTSPALVRFLIADRQEIAEATIDSARLGDGDWAALVPQLTVRSRQRLRSRGGLGPATRSLLAKLEAVDFALPPPVPAEPPANDVAATVSPPIAPGEIGALIARIEQFRAGRAGGEAPRLPLDDGEERAPLFDPAIAFDTDDGGRIRDVAGAPRGAFVGMNIGRAGLGSGTDRFGEEAFRRRLPLRNVRLVMAGDMAAAGEWRIHADPRFDQATGRFRGYSGQLRRPTVADTPVPPRPAPARGDLRELLHELRTPLGAIIGFAEIIESQLFGPVSQTYRAHAGAILADGRRLLAGFDDLDAAARLDDGRMTDTDGETCIGTVIAAVRERLGPVARERGIALSCEAADPQAKIAIGEAALDRMAVRLVAAMVSAAATGDMVRLTAGQSDDTGMMRIAVTIPSGLTHFDDATLFDGAIGAGQGDALLGLGFSLRLVRSLAKHHGGALDRDGSFLVLRLPAPAHAGALPSPITPLPPGPPTP